MRKMRQHIFTHVITHTVGIPPARPRRCCMPSGPASPDHSAITQQFVQQFVRGKTDSRPSTRPSPGARAPPARTGPLPAHQDLERLWPTGGVYAVPRGHHVISACTPR